MKKSNLMKLLFIALSLVLVISLVACVSETPTEEPDESDSSVEESVPNTEESGPQDPGEEESSEPTACEHVEEVVAGTAATCTTAGLTDGKKCSVCGETLVAQEEIPALGHTEEVVAGTAATCTTDGLTEGKKCSVCGETLVAQETIPAAHTEEVVTGTPATCETAGLTDGKKCSVCGETLVAQEEISALGHTKVDKAFVAATTAEEGWLAHTICEVCGKVWDTEGKELDAVPTLAKVVPTTEKYWGAYELANMTVRSSVAGSTFKDTVMSADRTYVRFERDGKESRDGAIYLVDNKESTEVTGQYIILKYRTDHMKQIELFATTEGGTNGSAHIYPTLKADNEWHIIIINLADQLSSYVKPKENGTYVLTWARIDILDTTASTGYFDIAWMVTCDDPAEVIPMMQEGDIALCPHAIAIDPEYTNNGDDHSTNCTLCGYTIISDHSMIGLPTWNAETMKYSGNCVCGATLEQDMLYVSEPATDPGQVKSFTIEQMDGYVRYTKNGTSDPFIHIYTGGKTVTGQYIVVKYRVSKAGMSYNNSFVGSVMGKHANANSGCDGNSGAGKSGNFIYTADGEWHYLIIELKSECFVANEDGTYSCRFFRLGFNNNASVAGDYIEIDEIAFASELIAAEKYAYSKDPNPPFKFCIDDGANTGINGATAKLPFTTKWGSNVTAVVDMKDSGDINATNGVAIGGWLVTYSGTASYKYRVTSVDGVAVENPTLIDGWNGHNNYASQGSALLLSESCGNGAAWQAKHWLDLTGYEGKTINVEVVAITNSGAEVVFMQINNINVAAAAAE